MRFPGQSTEALQREFETLLRPHLPVLFRVAHRFTGQPQDAEDLVQTVLLKLYPRLEELREVDNLQPWLMKVLYREFVDSTRRGKHLLHWLQPLDDSDQDETHLRALETTEGQPEQELARFQATKRLQQALNILNNDHRALVSLHDIEGYTMDEIASMLQLRRGTVKSRLHRARAKLRACLTMEPFALGERVRETEVNES